MCTGNNDELYARARAAGEADYLLEESLRVSLSRYPDYQRRQIEWAAAEARSQIAARRDDYALAAFDRALASVWEPDVDQARVLVESDVVDRDARAMHD